MKENINKIKGFMSFTIGAMLGSQAIQTIGNIGSGMSSGLKSATQSIIGIGILKSGSRLFK